MLKSPLLLINSTKTKAQSLYMQLYKTFSILCVLGILSSCGNKQSAPVQAPPQEVGVITVTSQTLPVTTELPGRIDAIRTSEVRARATGILLKRFFVEGSDVKEGDVLFQIDPAPLQAAYDSAKASLARAQAALTQAQTKADRYKALVAVNAVSKQDYEDTFAAALQAKADIETAKAAVETASLNLGYTRVTAPISGKIGEAKVTEGALVSQSEATELAVIQQLDPIYFDFSQSSTDVLRMRSAFEHGQLQKVAPDEAKVTLILEDGTIYQHPGKLLFSDITVDSTTGMITLRAQFPNSDHLLLPGMFARVQLEQAVDQNAISILQRAVTLGANGAATVMIVTVDNKVAPRTIKLGIAIEDKWIVTDGLKAGDTVIVEGLQKIKPGVMVKTIPFSQSDDSAAANPQSQGK
jgi:membrane fusion protein (multidrug efflux system)